ncbi:MAG: type IV pilus secretin PilQ [Thiotrichaceae bacterium]|nr:type IV pilus secretin PilQ [Thiotrichaceae bacterium]
MNTLGHLLKLALLPAAITLAIAGEANALQLMGVNNVISPDSTDVVFNFDSTVASPKAFVLHNPPRLVLDFYDIDKNHDLAKTLAGKGRIKRINLSQSNNRVRATLTLDSVNKFHTINKGNKIHLRIMNDTIVANKPQSRLEKDTAWLNEVMKSKQAPQVTYESETRPPLESKVVPHAQGSTRIMSNERQAPPPPPPPVQQASSVQHDYNANVDFTRDSKGSGKINIALPGSHVRPIIKRSGNFIVVTLKGVRSRVKQKAYNVLDFATPVKNISVLAQGANTKFRISVRGDFKFSNYQKDNKLVITVDKVIKHKTIKDIITQKKVYKGEKLTLNFQDIEVRSVLQLLADFTDKNIVVSDAVRGSITLRLKDVPWDQAMDIVLRSKGLGMRKNGTVIWVAPEAELAARENRQLEQLQKKQKLEPLTTEYLTINFAKAADLIKLINSDGNKSRSMLSDRGNISFDQRTNTILIHDTTERVNDVRAMVKSLDVPVRQVSIQSRIVIANDEFSREIGSRFGMTGLVGFNKSLVKDGGISSSGSTDATGAMSGGAGLPGINDRLNINLPAAGAPRLAFSLLSKDYLVDLELSALQAESKGEIISTPRVVTTNQQKATIEQGVEIPFLQASSSGAANVAFKKAVLSLEVTPQITPDDHVIMDLRVNQDTIGRVFNGVPSINTRQVQTRILVENGQTIVLGGVHEETNQNDVDKVPILGDLPIVGRLFKHTRKNTDKRELLIFVTPQILD